MYGSDEASALASAPPPMRASAPAPDITDDGDNIEEKVKRKFAYFSIFSRDEASVRPSVGP